MSAGPSSRGSSSPRRSASTIVPLARREATAGAPSPSRLADRAASLLPAWVLGIPLKAWGTLAVVVAIPVLLASCGPRESGVPVHPVSGKVTFDGQPPVGALVSLSPQGHVLPPGIVPSAKVQADGTFQVGTYAENDGAPAGDYAVTLQWFKVVTTDGGTGRGPNVLPKSYGSVADTPVKVTVKEGANSIAPIEIKKN